MKVGDTIIITNPKKTKLLLLDRFTAKIVKISEDRVWIDAKDVDNQRRSDRYYVLNGCFVTEDVYNSPLYKALL